MKSRTTLIKHALFPSLSVSWKKTNISENFTQINDFGQKPKSVVSKHPAAKPFSLTPSESTPAWQAGRLRGQEGAEEARTGPSGLCPAGLQLPGLWPIFAAVHFL
jgi:hypothetical protein